MKIVALSSLLVHSVHASPQAIKNCQDRCDNDLPPGTWDSVRASCKTGCVVMDADKAILPSECSKVSKYGCTSKFVKTLTFKDTNWGSKMHGDLGRCRTGMCFYVRPEGEQQERIIESYKYEPNPQLTPLENCKKDCEDEGAYSDPQWWGSVIATCKAGCLAMDEHPSLTNEQCTAIGEGAVCTAKFLQRITSNGGIDGTKPHPALGKCRVGCLKYVRPPKVERCDPVNCLEWKCKADEASDEPDWCSCYDADRDEDYEKEGCGVDTDDFSCKCE